LASKRKESEMIAELENQNREMENFK